MPATSENGLEPTEELVCPLTGAIVPRTLRGMQDNQIKLVKPVQCTPRSQNKWIEIELHEGRKLAQMSVPLFPPEKIYLGVSLKENDRGEQVAVSIDKNSPAHMAGLLPGCAILKIDGVDIKGLTDPEVRDLTHHFENTRMDLTIRQPGATQIVERLVWYRPKAELPIWDQDGDGKVSITEATQGYLQTFANVIFWGRKEGRAYYEKQWESQEMPAEHSKAMWAKQGFTGFDVHNSGELGKEELEEVLHYLPHVDGLGTLQEIMKILDLDGNGTVSRDEWVEFYEKAYFQVQNRLTPEQKKARAKKNWGKARDAIGGTILHPGNIFFDNGEGKESIAWRRKRAQELWDSILKKVKELKANKVMNSPKCGYSGDFRDERRNIHFCPRPGGDPSNNDKKGFLPGVDAGHDGDQVILDKSLSTASVLADKRAQSRGDSYGDKWHGSGQLNIRSVGLERCGVGCTLERRLHTGDIFILKVKPGGGCERAGIEPGCKIIAVDGTLVTGKQIGEIKDLCLGPEGSKTILSIVEPWQNDVASALSSKYSPRGEVKIINKTVWRHNDTQINGGGREGQGWGDRFVPASKSLAPVPKSRSPQLSVALHGAEQPVIANHHTRRSSGGWSRAVSSKGEENPAEENKSGSRQTIVDVLETGWERRYMSSAKYSPSSTSKSSAAFQCEFQCGFAGSFEMVSAHEANCALNPAISSDGMLVEDAVRQIVARNSNTRNTALQLLARSSDGSLFLGERPSKFDFECLEESEEAATVRPSSIPLLDEDELVQLAKRMMIEQVGPEWKGTYYRAPQAEAVADKTASFDELKRKLEDMDKTVRAMESY